MKERAILFSAPMVLAILAGRKIVTRRTERWALAKPGDVLWVKETWRTAKDLDGLSPVAIGVKAVDAGYRTPWAPIEYVADGKRNGNWSSWDVKEAGRTRVSIHMCRWMSRIARTVVSVRVERLDAITEEDAKAEGMVFHDGRGVGHSGWRRSHDHGVVFPTAREAFADLWKDLHGSALGDQPVVRVEFAPEARS